MECNLKTKAELISVLGEEMVNICLENPEKANAFGCLFSFAIAEFDQAYGIESLSSNNLLHIQEQLGEEFCIWCSKNYSKLSTLTKCFDSYVRTYQKGKKNKGYLNQLFKTINISNYKAEIIPFIEAFEKDNRTNLRDLVQKANLTYVHEIKRLFTSTLNEGDNYTLLKFIKWLRVDKKAALINDFQTLFKKSRTIRILKSRAKGLTLQEISLNLRITRQRVRQIQKKSQNNFENYIFKGMPHYILYAFSKTRGYIEVNHIQQIFGDLADIFIYCLKESGCASVHWCSELDGFIIGDGKWYTQLKDYKSKLPEMLYYDSVDPLIYQLKRYLSLPLSFNDSKKIILNGYTLSGKVYLKRKISLSQMYHAVLETYYPDGIELYSDSEALSFRRNVRRLFGDVYLPSNNRALDVRLADFTILCDRRKRILPSAAKVSLELLSKIHDDITKSEKLEITFRELFERYKYELLATSNISNIYFLQGLLRYLYSNEFNFTRYKLKKRNFN